MNRIALIVLAIATIQLSSTAEADSWLAYKPERVEEKFAFGLVTITKIRDTTTNQNFPSYTVLIHKAGVLQGMYKEVSFEKIFASKDNEIFVGLSNSGLSADTALVVFRADGSLRMLLRHSDFSLDYCNESITVVREWFDAASPDVEFIYSNPGTASESLQEIYLNDCRHKRVALSEILVNGHKNFIERYEKFEQLKKKSK